MKGRPRRKPPNSDEPVSDDLPTLFGKNLREARIRAGLTQAQVAERTGLTQQYVSLVRYGIVVNIESSGRYEIEPDVTI